MNKSLSTADNLDGSKMHCSHFVFEDDCSIRVYQSLAQKYFLWYAGIMLNAFSDLLYSKLGTLA